MRCKLGLATADGRSVLSAELTRLNPDGPAHAQGTGQSAPYMPLFIQLLFLYCAVHL